MVTKGVISVAGIGILIPDTLTMKTVKFIIFVTMVEVDLGLKIPATISLAIAEFIIFVLMVKVELGLKRPTTFTI